MKFATPSTAFTPSNVVPLDSRRDARRPDARGSGFLPKADPALDLVRFALAQHLGVDLAEIEESHDLDHELGLDPLDLVLIVLRLEELGEVEFPVAELERVATVGDLTEMVRSWWRRSCEEATMPPPAPERTRESSPPASVRPESGMHFRGVIPFPRSSQVS